MLFKDASAILAMNNAQYQSILLVRSVQKGCPLAPSLFILVVEAFSYLLAFQASQGMIKGIALPHSYKSLLNGHFADDSFLTMTEDEQSINTTFKCLNTFCLASRSSIQWNKTSCYRQSFKDIPHWLINFPWKWIQPGETFKFLGIPFAFEASPA